jgi:serine/threonine protein kinase
VLPKQRNKLTKERTLEKVVRETDILERLQSCRSVVQLEDCFEDESSVSLIMELCSGGDLQKHVEVCRNGHFCLNWAAGQLLLLLLGGSSKYCLLNVLNSGLTSAQRAFPAEQWSP